MKKILFAVLFGMFAVASNAQDVENVKPVKNVIVMIPDGCSLATISTARWYQWYKNPNAPKLAIDPYICGTVRTTCSNAPIGDSAPTTSCYMTGYPSLAGWVSTYPKADPKNDIYPMDSTRAYQPLTTVLEAARLLKGKATGLVTTCQFAHATPADCSAHNHNRGANAEIVSQQVHNSLNVVIGGGTANMTDEHANYLRSKGYDVLKNDIEGLRTNTNNNIFAQFRHGDMTNDIDRDPAKEPSLAEMTEIAIKKLSTDPDGFFLMVEGSKVDYSAHANDPIGMVTEFLAFDRACGVALDFARKDGNTAVVILSDHGNSGLSIGRRDWHGYSGDSKEKMFSALTKCKITSDEMAKKVKETEFENMQNLFNEWFGFTLDDKELEAIKYCREYKKSPVPEDERKQYRSSLYSSGLVSMIGQFVTKRTGLAFTTGGHTGEEVLLAAYHPDRDSRPYGMLTNIELNHYLCNLYGFSHDDLDRLTDENFAQHTSVFNGMKYEIKDKVLTVKKGKKKLEIKPNTNIVKFNGNDVELPTVIIYVDKKDMFYLPKSLREMF
ncbi:MAG: alkaline phosphatase [Prevotellaceae bacterium]|nr:alkaline phosphatase [Prevotellaceae bacterium]